MGDIAKSKRGRNWKKPKMPGVSWTIKEKLDVVNAICSDRRFSHAEVRAAVVMVLYFHNTQSGELHPSRPEVSDRACVGKEIVINATKKMRRLDYMHYVESDGGCNHRNTYYLKKQTVGNSDPQRSEKTTPPVGKNDPQGSEKTTRNYPCKDITGKGEASPPTLKRVEASLKEEEASRGAQVLTFPETETASPVEKPFSVSEEVRTENLNKLRNLRRTLGG
jgi:hypothetical protein